MRRALMKTEAATAPATTRPLINYSSEGFAVKAPAILVSSVVAGVFAPLKP
jgi:hypothetical protein